MSFLANTLSWYVLLTMGILRSQNFLDGSSGKECACQCRSLIEDSDVIPGSGRSPGGGHVNPFQCSCLEKPMDKSQT